MFVTIAADLLSYILFGLFLSSKIGIHLDLFVVLFSSWWVFVRKYNYLHSIINNVMVTRKRVEFSVSF